MQSDVPGHVKISVLIPTFNMAQYLPGAISSVLRGSFDDVEIIVVDDGSVDDTQQMMRRFTESGRADYDARVQCVYKPNGGKPTAVNYAFSMARGEYITILDADDKFTSDSLSARYAAARAGTGKRAEVVVGGFEVFEEGEVCGHRKAPAATDPRVLRRDFLFSYKTPFHFNACLISKEAISSTGFFDTRLRRCQDIDYALRLLQQVDEVAVVDKPVYRYRKHRQSVLDRMKFRKQTIFYRSLVLWKNARGFLKPGAACYGAAMDIAKAIYELRGNYKR